MAMHPRHVALGLLAALIWGATFIFSALALREIPPFLFTSLRFLCAATFAFVIARPSVSWKRLLACGLFLGLMQYGLMFYAMANGVPPGLASVLSHTQALWSILFAAIAFREHLGGRQYGALALGVGGFIVLFVDSGSGLNPVGIVVMILSACSGATGNLILKRTVRASAASVAVWMSLVPPIPLFALSLMIEGPTAIAHSLVSMSAMALISILYSGIFATVLAFAIWGKLFSLYPVNRVAPFMLLVPVFGIALSVVIFHEHFDLMRILCVVLLLAAMLVGTMPINLFRRQTELRSD